MVTIHYNEGLFAIAEVYVIVLWYNHIDWLVYSIELGASATVLSELATLQVYCIHVGWRYYKFVATYDKSSPFFTSCNKQVNMLIKIGMIAKKDGINVVIQKHQSIWMKFIYLQTQIDIRLKDTVGLRKTDQMIRN